MTDLEAIGAGRIAKMLDNEVQLLAQVIDHMGSGQHPCAGYATPEETRNGTLKGFTLEYALECLHKATPHLNADGVKVGLRIVAVLEGDA